MLETVWIRPCSSECQSTFGHNYIRYFHLRERTWILPHLKSLQIALVCSLLESGCSHFTYLINHRPCISAYSLKSKLNLTLLKTYPCQIHMYSCQNTFANCPMAPGQFALKVYSQGREQKCCFYIYWQAWFAWTHKKVFFLNICAHGKGEYLWSGVCNL